MEELTAGLLFNDTMVMIAGGGGGKKDGEFSSPSPSGYSSSNSSSCSPYYSNQIPLPSELFQEFNEFSGFELGCNDDNGAGFLQQGSSDEEQSKYMEDLISSDLSSDEDKFLETIRYGGGGVVHFSNEVLSEEELVNTIQTYGDVEVVQVDGGDEVKKGKKRKGSVGGGGNSVKGVKRTLIIQQQAPASSKKHKQTIPRVFEDEIVIETENGAELGSPSPGSPQQQAQDSNGAFQELKLSDEEKRLLMKEGISLPTHYPLTRAQERELKRIRRKIRNKISAQDSRKRKKEFLDRLQQKLQEVEDEKSILQKRVRSLESINTKLNGQVKRLQQALASGVSNGAATQKQTVVPAATTLLVLILSLALVVLPTSLENGAHEGNGNEIISLLNRSNEMSGRVLGGGGGGGGKGVVPRSRTMVGEEEMDEEDIMDVRELIGQMRMMLKSKRRGKEVFGGGSLFGGVKKRKVDGGGGGGSSGIGVGVGVKNDGWWASDDEDGGVVEGGRGRFNRAFQVVDDVEVD